jgi:nucleotide-binding universal stress UspA family protein
VYRKIVVGYDGSDLANDALALGKQLAAATRAELILGGVSIIHPLLRGDADQLALDNERALSAKLEAAGQEAGATSRPVESSSVARGLHYLAEETGADLIVVGSSRHGKLGQTLLGNVAVNLMHGAPCAVAIAPRGYRETAAESPSTLVVGYDGSPEAKLALEAASELGRATGAQVRLVAAAEPPPVVYGKSGGMTGGWAAIQEEIEQHLRQELDAAKSSLPSDIHADAEVSPHEPAEALAKEAGEPGSLIFIGSRAYGPVRRVLLGSVSRALARSAPAPIIVQPRGSHPEPDIATPAGEGTTA